MVLRARASRGASRHNEATRVIKRVKNQSKQDWEEEAEEGKQPLQFAGYKWLAKQAMQSKTDF
eukprot:1839781-Rhodomonas_salina.1